MAITREVFENKCMDIIEQIVSVDVKQDRQGAILIAEKLLEKAKASGKPARYTSLYACTK